MTQTNETLHPVMAAAYEYADQRTNTSDRATYDKSWANNRDTYLFSAGIGVFQLIKEISAHPDQEPPYTLLEAYQLLVLIEKSISGLIGTFSQALVSSGVASSTNEANLILSQARFTLEQTRNLENPQQPVPMIGVVGPISSGKGTIGEQLQTKFGGAHLPLSDRLREVSLARGGDKTFPRSVLREVNDTLKPIYGNDIFVRWTIDIAQRQANRHHYPVVSMDGFRSVEEAQTFKNAGGILIGVTASQETRFQRLIARGRVGDDGWESFVESDAIESAWINPILDICDFTIDNNGDEGTLEQQVDTILDQLSLGD
jgi:dephospho-CoA kinase